MSPRRDVDQFRQACRELEFSDEERFEASDDFHAEKESGAPKGHRDYGDLKDWLRQWKEDR
jgi:hypothetical protein